MGSDRQTVPTGCPVAVGIELAVWRIHRRIGMSGGLFVNTLLREVEAADPLPAG